MRGKGLEIEIAGVPHGITPAYAGKSLRLFHRKRKTGDHPRLCGEKAHVRTIYFPDSGSPPPMRGKGLTIAAKPSFVRITPAYAGKRTPQNPKNPVRRDHPRLCGEKGFSTQILGQFAGSPPPMRGKASVKTLGISTYRITPAYAGKSSCMLDCIFPDEDHPRLCGEKK